MMMQLCAVETTGEGDDSEKDEFTARMKWDQFEHTLLSKNVSELSPGDEKRVRSWFDALNTKEEKMVALELLDWGRFGRIILGKLHVDLIGVMIRDQDRYIALRAADLAWTHSCYKKYKSEIEALLANLTSNEVYIIRHFFSRNDDPALKKKLDSILEKDPLFQSMHKRIIESSEEAKAIGFADKWGKENLSEDHEILMDRLVNKQANATTFAQIRHSKSRVFIKKLIELTLPQNDSETRSQALVSLLFIDGRAQEDLFVRMLDDSNLEMRMTAAYCLGDLRLSKHADKIAKLLKNIPGEPMASEAQQNCAVTVLGALGDKSYASQITPLLEIEATRANVARTLVHLGAKEQVGKIIQYYNEIEYPAVLTHAIYLLGDPEKDAEKIKLRSDGSDYGNSAWLLGKWNQDEAIPHLKTLAKKGESIILSMLHAKLKSSNAQHRAYALECLSVKVDDPVVHDWITTIIKTEENEELRKKATDLLAE